MSSRFTHALIWLGVVQGALIYVAAPIGWALVPLPHAIQFFEV